MSRDLTSTANRTNLMRFVRYIVCLIALIVVVPALQAQQLQPAPGVALQGPDHYTFRVGATLHPGHTPGSAFYTLVSAGQNIVFVGDIIHVAAVQAPAPEVTITYDVDPVHAASVRKEAFADFANERTLVAVPHLPFPGVGHLRTNGTGFEWILITYGNR